MMLFKKGGYRELHPAGLPVKTWREAAAEHSSDRAVLMVEQMVGHRVASPI